METSIETQLELTKVNKIVEKLTEGHSVDDICKDLGLSLRQLVKYVNSEELEAVLGKSHKALKSLIFNKLSVLVESSLDKLEYLQQELIREADPELAQMTISKISALNNLVNTYLKSLSLVQVSDDTVQVEQGLTKENIKAIFETIVRM